MRNTNLLKSSLMILLICFGFTGLWGQLANWNPGSLGSTWGPSPWAATSKDANVTVTGLVRGSGFGTSGTPASNSFGGSGANQTTASAAISGGDIFTTTIKANTGYKMSITGIPTWYTRKSGSGTISILVQYSLNGGAFTDIGSISVTSTSGTGSSTPLVFNTTIQNALKDLPSSTTVTLRFVVISSTNANIYLTLGAGDRLSIAGSTAVASSPCPTPTAGSIADQEVFAPDAATFTLTGASNYTSIQWQRNTGSSWVNVSGSATTYSTGATTTSMDGYMYRTVLTNAPAGCTATNATTTAATLFVSESVIAPELEDANLPGTVGVPFTYQIVNNGGAADLYEVVDGALPTGLTLNETTGQITGTPTVAGDFGAEIYAENEEGIGDAWIDFSISQGTQTVAGLTDLSKNINDAPFTLPATTNAGLTLSYSSSDTSVASVSGNTVTLEGLGSTTITATQAGDENWNSFTQEIILTVVDGPCGGETFTNMGARVSTYGTRTWTGDNGIEWEATDARTDYGLGGSWAADDDPDERAIAIRIGTLTNTTTISTGVGVLSFQYARIFTTGSPVLKIFVNDVQYGGDVIVPEGNPNPISEFNEIINVEGDVTIRIEVSGTGARAAIDNISWTCYSAPDEPITWTSEGEWSNGTGPETTDDDIIIEGNLATTTNLLGKNLTIAETGNLTVSAGNSVTLAGKIINNASAENFTVESGANLIQNTDYTTNDNEGGITVQRESQTLVRLDYSMWSSPVTGQQLQGFSPTTLPGRIYVYEGVSGYVEVADANANFENGKGYLFRAPNDWSTDPAIYPGEFIGTPFNGNLNIPVFANNYTSVGNPYPSNIDPELLLAGNTDIQTLYFWNNPERIDNGDGTWSYTGTKYITFTGAGFSDPSYDGNSITVGQGFIVESTGSSVNFTNEMRVADAGEFFKNGAEKHRLWLNLSNEENHNYNNILIGYMEGATQGIDTQIDGKIFGYEGSALYNIINEEKFTIQGRALPFETTDVVQLGFKAVEEGKFNISLSNFDGLFTEGEVIVYLKDNELNVTHNLMESAYTFESAAGEFKNRFEIVYEEESVMGTGDLTANSVQVYKQNENIVISSKTEKILSVELFDLQGRNIFKNDKVNANFYQIKSNSKGVLVVKVQTNDGKIITKKIINN